MMRFAGGRGRLKLSDCLLGRWVEGGFRREGEGGRKRDVLFFLLGGGGGQRRELSRFVIPYNFFFHMYITINNLIMFSMKS